MPRAVRFNSGNLVLKSPEELSSPHHAWRGNTPTGILRRAGLFELNDENRSNPRERRSRRHSTPINAVGEIQSMHISEIAPRSRENEEHRSRRRSMPVPYYAPQVLQKSGHDHAELDRSPLSPLCDQTSHFRFNESSTAYKRASGSAYNPTAHWSNVAQGHYGRPIDVPLISLPVPNPSRVSPGVNAHIGTPLPPTPSSRASSSPRSIDLESTSSLEDVVVSQYLAHPQIAWNIAHPHSSAINSSRSWVPAEHLDLAATVPGLDKLTIRVSHSKIQKYLSGWGPIKIRGSRIVEHGGSSIGVVTVKDVVDAIYNHFHAHLDPGEWDRVQEPFRTVVRDAQRRRLRDSGSRRRDSYSSSVPVRADMLGDGQRFRGVYIRAVKERKIEFGLDLGTW